MKPFVPLFASLFAVAFALATSAGAADLVTNLWHAVVPPAGSRVASPPAPTSPPDGTRTFTNLQELHDNYADEFATKPGFGPSRIVFLPPANYFTYHGGTFRFTAPDLIGLEHDPVAYRRRRQETISVAVLAKKESRACLQRRALTAAESSAVASLRAGQELVLLPNFDRGPEDVRGMLAVGALRATAHCAECHQVKEGALLGALVYTLVPVSPPSDAPRTLRDDQTTRIGIQYRTPAAPAAGPGMSVNYPAAFVPGSTSTAPLSGISLTNLLQSPNRWLTRLPATTSTLLP